jgi:hypothetical protein
VQHEREGEWEEGKEQNWVTILPRDDCAFCFYRLQRQLRILKIQSENFAVLMLFNSSGRCCVEFQFVDLEDGVSEWTYWFWYTLSREERLQYGGTV